MDLQFVGDGPYDPKFVALAKCRTGVGTQGAGDLGEALDFEGLKIWSHGISTAYSKKHFCSPREAHPSFYPTAYPQGISS